MHSKHLSLFGGKMRGALYELNFLVNLAIAVISFYLGVFADSIGVTGMYTGLMFFMGSTISIIALTQIAPVIERLGIKRTLLLSSGLYCVSLLLIASAHSFFTLMIPYALISIGIVYTTCALDMYVSENTSHAHITGKVRGIFLAVSNISFVIGPIVGGLLIQIGGFPALYGVSAAFLIPFIAIVYERLPNIRELSHKHTHSIKSSLRKIWNNVQLREVFLAQSIYRKYSATFATYAGLYLTQVVNLSYIEIGIIFTAMLIPYVIVEVPLGKMLDSTWSEKTPAMIGFFIMAVMLTIISISGIPSIYFWVIVFFVLGIGGGMVELSIESYFFRHVSATSEEEVAAFRAVYPLAFLFGPISGSVVIYFGGYYLLFVLLAFTLVYGIYVANKFE